MTDVDIIHQARAEVGEGPTWDARTGELHWVDILQGTIWTDRLDGSAPTSLMLDTHVGAALPAADTGELLVCTRAGFSRLDRATGHEQLLAQPLAERPGVRFNDAKVSPDGRAFGDTMPYDTDAEPGALYRLDAPATVATIAEPLRLGNGLGWAPDGRTMYFIDSGARTMWRASYDTETGTVTGARPFIEFDPAAGGMPDGMCVDSDGGLWVAIMGGGRIERYSPSGILDRAVELPLHRPTSLCFAGAELDTLIVTSLSYQMTEAEWQADPLAGSVLALDVHTTGPAATPWNPELIGAPTSMRNEN